MRPDSRPPRISPHPSPLPQRGEGKDRPPFGQNHTHKVKILPFFLRASPLLPFFGQYTGPLPRMQQGGRVRRGGTPQPTGLQGTSALHRRDAAPSDGKPIRLLIFAKPLTPPWPKTRESRVPTICEAQQEPCSSGPAPFGCLSRAPRRGDAAGGQRQAGGSPAGVQ